MGLVSKIMDFRLNVDTEYQGWILMFATMTAIWVYCLPCYCAGLTWEWQRNLAAKIQRRLPYFMLVATIFNAVMLFLIITWLPDWGYGDYIKCLVKALGFLAKYAMKFATSMAMIVVFVFVIAFRDRFAKVLGVDYKTIFRFKLRDMCPGGAPTRAIKLVIYKVEELKASSVFSPNNVFIETHFGYNQPMTTRVHNNAGSNCILKERVQLNFDPEEDEETLYLLVKNQKVVGTSELCHIEFNSAELLQLEKESSQRRRSGADWADSSFIEKRMIPQGKLFLRVEAVVDEDHNASC